ncbi:MAG: hypothetical protein OXI16_02405 [Chloroflexota bacterium]|nr:hypothetical protein [Chloroflexota bacterium]
MRGSSKFRLILLAMLLFAVLTMATVLVLHRGEANARVAGFEGRASPGAEQSISDTELQDLQAVAEQYGISLQEAIDRYAWRDNFSQAASRIRETAPTSFAGAEIVGDDRAWIAFTGDAPESALEIIDTFTRSYSGIHVEIRTDYGFSEVELNEAIPAVHYAVLTMPDVRDATTSFDPDTAQITMSVTLEGVDSDSVQAELMTVATSALIDATRPDILDSISVSVRISNGETLGSYDKSVK